MDQRKTLDIPDCSDHRRAAVSLVFAAFVTLPLNVLAGFLCGALFLLIGAPAGAALAVPFGYLAALFAGAIGGKPTWGIAYTVCGTLGGLFLTFLVDLWPSPSWVLFCTLVPATGAGLLGLILGSQLENPDRQQRGLIGVIYRRLYDSPLYLLPLSLRLTIAAIGGSPVFLLLACALISKATSVVHQY